jgi:GGDEF domain-containing protein
MTDKLLELYKDDAQLYRNELTSFLRMFAVRREWPETKEERDAVDPRVRQERTDRELSDVLKEVQQFYANQMEKFNDHSKERTEDEKRYGLLHPVVIADHLLKKFPFSDTEKKDLLEIVRKSFPEDALMGSLPGDKTPGFYDKRCMPALVGFAHLFAKLVPEEPVCLVEGDFTNIKMCNRTLTREGTDKLMRSISELVKEKFEGSGAKEVECVRQGGDELRLVIYGLSRENVNKVLKQQVHPALNLLAAQYGVQEIAHSKGGSPPGFGAGFASVRLDGSPDSDPGKIQSHLEKAMSLQKEHDGFLRFGLFNKNEE